ncbi:MAG: DoxX family protein [Parcubacteria group bacterium]|nr:DoxX family protein [Parcubacteria group bacterium]
MLNIFPDLLFLQILAPFLLRVTLGVMFLWIGYSYLFKDRVAIIRQLSSKWPKLAKVSIIFGGILEAITGVFLIIGLFTQAAAIVGALIAIDALFGKFFYKELDKALKYSKMFYILILIISLSLIISGAGAFAFDLPL